MCALLRDRVVGYLVKQGWWVLDRFFELWWRDQEEAQVS